MTCPHESFVRIQTRTKTDTVNSPGAEVSAVTSGPTTFEYLYRCGTCHRHVLDPKSLRGAPPPGEGGIIVPAKSVVVGDLVSLHQFGAVRRDEVVRVILDKEVRLRFAHGSALCWLDTPVRVGGEP